MTTTEKETDHAKQIGLAIALAFPAMLEALDKGNRDLAIKKLSDYAMIANKDGDTIAAQIFLQCATAINKTWAKPTT